MTRPGDRLSKTALLVGYCALGVGVLVAHGSPATGYELSIYGATPLAFWASVGVAFLAAFFVAGVLRERGVRLAGALCLAGAASVTVASLPVLRGYYFYGSGDSLTHYGWVTDIASGALNPFNFLYPGIHLSALLLRDGLGVSSRLAVMLIVTVYVLLFVAFVPLCVRAITGVDDALVVGTFAAVLLLPVNDVSVFLMAHPSSDGILFLPFVLYIAFRYLRAPTPDSYRFAVTPTGVVLALVTTAILFVHPQQALNVILLFATIVLVQWVGRHSRWFAPTRSHRPLYAQTAYLLVAFLLWAPRYQRTQSMSTAIIDHLLHGLPQTDTVSTHGASLAALGGSLAGLFVKLFLPSLLFCLIAGVVMVASLRTRYGDTLPGRRGLATYLTVALVPLGFAFLTVMITLSGEQRFRYLGFLMVPVLVLGAVGVTWGVRRVARTRSERGAWAVVSLLFALLLPLCLATYFLAPFIYQPNSQVTQGEMTGYQWTFAHQDQGVPLLGIHGGERRYADAIYGSAIVQNDDATYDIPGLTSVVPPPVLATNLTTHYPTDRYLVVSRENDLIEEQLYRGLRYPRGSIASLDRTRGVDRVQSNGAVRLYYVDNATAAP